MAVPVSFDAIQQAGGTLQGADLDQLLVQHDPANSQMVLGDGTVVSVTIDHTSKTAGTGVAGTVDTYTAWGDVGETVVKGTFTVLNGATGSTGNTGATGQDIDHTSLTSGTGAEGTVDTYTAWGDSGETITIGTFTVLNGATGAKGDPGVAGSGTGDMLVSDYDPNVIQADVFSMDSMVEGADAKILTASERTNLGGLAAITATITANAVAVVQFDVADWHPEARRQWMNDVHRSWNTEALNTATRGAKLGGIAKGLIVAEAAKVTIYDLTDPGVPMWMVFNAGIGQMLYNNSIASIAFHNGKLVAADSGAGGGANVIDFLGDLRDLWRVGATWRYKGDISERNANLSHSSRVTDGIASNAVNSVAITTLKNAPLVNGVPVSTIYAATNGGVSQIGWDGVGSDNVWDATASGAGYGEVVTFDDGFAFGVDNSPGSLFRRTVQVHKTLTADVFQFWQSAGVAEVYSQTFASIANLPILGSVSHMSGNMLGGSSGVTLLHRKPSNPSSGMVAYITSLYNTGWMHGNTVRCFLANSKSADRSVKAATLVENGTVTETVNAGGVNTYGATSAVDYFEEPTSADWNNIGTGDFWFDMWATGNLQFNSLFELGNIGGDHVTAYISSGSSAVTFRVKKGAAANYDSLSGFSSSDTAWQKLSFIRDAGVLYIYINGSMVKSFAVATDISIPTATLRIGNATSAWSTGYNNMALFKVGLTAPSAEQVKFMYDQEKQLFGTDSKALLTASAVTDSEYLKSSGICAVETAGAYDYLKGLEVLHRGIAKDDTTDLGFDRVQVNGTTDVRVSMKAVPLREQLVLNSANGSTPPKVVYANGTAYSAPQGSTIVAAIDMITGLPFDFDLTPVLFDGFIYSVTLATANKHMITLEAVQ